MNKYIISFFIIVFVSLITLKSLDLVFHYFTKENNLVQHRVELNTNRHINLRELIPNDEIWLPQPKNYLSASKSINKKNKVRLRIDGEGFLKTGNDLIETNEKIDLSILFLGGSTTENTFVPEKSRFPSFVERSLSSRLNKNVKVFNGGVSGNHSMHSFFNFLAKGIKLNPDYVIIMHNVNDLSYLTKTGSYFLAPPKRNIIVYKDKVNFISIAREIKNFLIPNLYPYLKSRFYSQSLKNYDEWIDFRDKNENTKKTEEDFRSSLKSIIFTAKSWNIKILLMTQPNRINMKDEIFEKEFSGYQSNGIKKQDFVQAYKNFNKIIKELAKLNNVSLVNLESSVPSSNEFMYDSVHLTEAGNLLVGELISDKLFEIISKN